MALAREFSDHKGRQVARHSPSTSRLNATSRACCARAHPSLSRRRHSACCAPSPGKPSRSDERRIAGRGLESSARHRSGTADSSAELRTVLDDDARNTRFIETMARRDTGSSPRSGTRCFARCSTSVRLPRSARTSTGGSALERERAARVPVTPTALAMHFERAGEPLAAVRYYPKPQKRRLRTSARKTASASSNARHRYSSEYTTNFASCTSRYERFTALPRRKCLARERRRSGRSSGG